MMTYSPSITITEGIPTHMMTRTRFLMSTAASLAALLPIKTKAQLTTQEVLNELSVVSTGDVNVNQEAAGNQEVFTADTPDGIYRTETSQVVVNGGRIVSTGDVDVSQRASGNQEVTVVYPERGGDKADYCQPGAVIANPNTGQVFYQGFDCCWWPACASDCQKAGCEGNRCGK